ncbi:MULTISPECIES: hypothetical protein [Pseudomonas aeruginosa group]|uniref:Uncharacterized protein n=3 Tax=Pseudomonas aeruginosa group TaxID=136841 RepID=A0ABD7K5V2_PSEAI|nr:MULTISPECIES: hypothetical protein [Pseudomonas aeruginosa group]KFF35851.1 hypothetical protein G039_0305635 [Pseudomonas aeruginosa VRFPA01]VTS53118.1 Uncharacterised protein [Streptococcus dysgalactiae subsp. equisimilis]ABR84043.1 hypothetical protein PSPA7_1321 [Pseudomonas aeruginosa PA7]AVK03826.1 hypothetical protein CSB93_2474 [Pseudomonas paraeruginosa]AVR66550.1 hypothetical protein B7D75_06095 [Pseudomonas paraeruginosa]
MSSDTENPFRPPEARLDEPGATQGEPLYRLSAIGLGTFIGTPLAGAFLTAVNLRRLGRGQEVGRAWLVAVGLFVLLLVLGAILPENIPSTGFAVAQIIGMVYYARSAFGPALESHKAAGGSFISNWRAAGIALLFMLAVLLVMVPVVMLVA